MRGILFFLAFNACALNTAFYLNVDGTYAPDSPLGRRFVQSLNLLNLQTSGFADAPDGVSFTIDDQNRFTYTSTNGEAVIYTLESLRDERRAYLTRPRALRNGVDFITAFDGVVISNGVLYEAGRLTPLLDTGDDSGTRLFFEKNNITFAFLAVNKDGTPTRVAQP